MAKITEDYVSFETAKLLKEKGFNEICYLGYNKNGEYLPTGNRCNSQIIQPDFCFICCPTLQLAMKWLREVHHIDVSIIPLRSHKEYLPRIESDTISHDAIPCRKYEEACEAAIKYCLEHLI